MGRKYGQLLLREAHDRDESGLKQTILATSETSEQCEAHDRDESGPENFRLGISDFGIRSGADLVW